MALADDAELIVLAPGCTSSARTDDRHADRKYGYCGTPATLEAVKNDPRWQAIFRGGTPDPRSSEGRFKIRYCPGHLTREEIEGAHSEYATG